MMSESKFYPRKPKPGEYIIQNDIGGYYVRDAESL